jgi:dTMP kinase
VVFLDLNVEEAAKRKGFGEERYETLQFQKKVYQIFFQLQDTRWKYINANQSIEKIQEELRPLVLSTMKNVEHYPLTELWSNSL